MRDLFIIGLHTMESEVVFFFFCFIRSWWNDQLPYSSKSLSSYDYLYKYFFRYYLSLRKIRKLIIDNVYIS